MEGFPDPLLIERLMMRECLYSTKMREELGNPFSPPSKFPSGNLSGVGDGFPNTSLVLVADQFFTAINGSN